MTKRTRSAFETGGVGGESKVAKRPRMETLVEPLVEPLMEPFVEPLVELAPSSAESAQTEAEEGALLLRAIRAQDIGAVNRLLAAGVQPLAVPHVEAALELPHTVSSQARAQILTALVEALSNEQLDEAFWLTDAPDLYRLALLRIAARGTEQQRDQVREQLSVFLPLVEEMGNLEVLQLVWPEMSTDDKLHLVHTSRAGNLVAYTALALGRPLRQLFARAPDEDLKQYAERLERVHQLLLHTPLQAEAARLLGHYRPEFRVLTARFQGWSNRAELAVNLHLRLGDCKRPDCEGELDAALVAIQEHLEDLDGYLASVLARTTAGRGRTFGLSEPEAAVLKPSALVANEDDLQSNAMSQFADAVVLAVPSAAGDAVFRFSALDLPALLAKNENPYNNEPLSPAALARVHALGDWLRAHRMRHLLPLGDALAVLTDASVPLPEERARAEEAEQRERKARAPLDEQLVDLLQPETDYWSLENLRQQLPDFAAEGGHGATAWQLLRETLTDAGIDLPLLARGPPTRSALLQALLAYARGASPEARRILSFALGVFLTAMTTLEQLEAGGALEHVAAS